VTPSRRHLFALLGLVLPVAAFTVSPALAATSAATHKSHSHHATNTSHKTKAHHSSSVRHVSHTTHQSSHKAPAAS